MKESIVLLGAGALAREIEAFLQDSLEVKVRIVEKGFPTPPGIRSFAWLEEKRNELGLGHYLLAVGDMEARERMAAKADELGVAPVSLGYLCERRRVKVRPGTVIFPESSVTVDVTMGRHVLVQPGSTIAHDCVLEDFAVLSPGVHLAGGVRVGRAAFLGIGAVVLPRIRIGARAVVGAGAVVTRDVPDGATVKGNPAQ